MREELLSMLAETSLGHINRATKDLPPWVSQLLVWDP